MIFKLIFLCLSLLLRGSASEIFCILRDVLFLWDIALILLGHRNYAIGVLQNLYWGQSNRTQVRSTQNAGSFYLKRRLVLPKTQARFGRQNVISLFLIQYFDLIFLLLQRIAFQHRE